MSQPDYLHGYRREAYHDFVEVSEHIHLKGSESHEEGEEERRKLEITGVAGIPNGPRIIFQGKEEGSVETGSIQWLNQDETDHMILGHSNDTLYLMHSDQKMTVWDNTKVLWSFRKDRDYDTSLYYFTYPFPGGLGGNYLRIDGGLIFEDSSLRELKTEIEPIDLDISWLKTLKLQKYKEIRTGDDCV